MGKERKITYHNDTEDGVYSPPLPKTGENFSKKAVEELIHIVRENKRIVDAHNNSL